MTATEPVRSKKDLKRLAGYYLKNGQLRNHALIVLAVYTALRISDLLRLRWSDVYDFENERFLSHISLTEGKTGKHRAIALNKDARTALENYLPFKKGIFIFASNRKNAAPIGRVQAYRIIKSAAKAVKLAVKISCHLLRKTLGYHAWRAGVAAAVIDRGNQRL